MFREDVVVLANHGGVMSVRRLGSSGWAATSPSVIYWVELLEAVVPWQVHGPP